MRLADLPAAMQAQVIAATGAPKPKAKAPESEAAELFWWHLKAHGFTAWVREYRFALQALERGWRFDFAQRHHRVAVEIEGLRVQTIGTRTVCTGRHSTPDGYRGDLRKYNAANELGWELIRADQSMVKSGEAIAALVRLYEKRGWERGGVALELPQPDPLGVGRTAAIPRPMSRARNARRAGPRAL